MVPAVAVNCAVAEPEATVTAAGTVRAARLLESDTGTPPEPAAFDRVTVQVELAPDKRLLGKHDIAFTTVGATKPTLNVLELAL
jgi:hypothetical protein